MSETSKHETFTPQDPSQVEEVIRWALGAKTPLDVIGRGTKRALGRPVTAAGAVLDLSGLSGIEVYEAEELILTAQAATPLAEVQAALSAQHQMLAFEPWDPGPLLGGPAGAGTLGGTILAGLSGPRRIQSGAARDHLLGFKGVSGRGETFKSGGRVVKNVTGFDLSKLLAGSFGTLAAVTEITCKVLPRPEKARTVLVLGLDDDQAGQVLRRALASPYEVSAAAHLPERVAAKSEVAYVAGAGASVTAIRVEGPGLSVAFRCEALQGLLKDYGAVEELHTENTIRFWREVRDALAFAAPEFKDSQVWRISVPPSDGPDVGARLKNATGGEVFYDWGGGLIWLAHPAAQDALADTVRAQITDTTGHATLIRADEQVRGSIYVHQPLPAAIAALSSRVRGAFDPEGILNPGRM